MWDYTIEIHQQCTHYKSNWNVGGYYQWNFFDERFYPKCDCPAYKYSKSYEGEKTCKHIKEVEKQMCTWHSLYGEAQTEEQKENMICPRCRRQTEYVKVAV